MSHSIEKLILGDDFGPFRHNHASNRRDRQLIERRDEAARHQRLHFKRPQRSNRVLFLACEALAEGHVILTCLCQLCLELAEHQILLLELLDIIFIFLAHFAYFSVDFSVLCKSTFTYTDLTLELFDLVLEFNDCLLLFNTEHLVVLSDVL